MTDTMPTYPAEFSEDIESLDDLQGIIPSADEHLACEWGNEQACRDDNAIRAGFAAIAVKAYGERTCPGGEELETIISDLLGDLRHLCDGLGFDFDALSSSGEFHYEHELHGEF